MDGYGHTATSYSKCEKHLNEQSFQHIYALPMSGMKYKEATKLNTGISHGAPYRTHLGQITVSNYLSTKLTV